MRPLSREAGSWAAVTVQFILAVPVCGNAWANDGIRIIHIRFA